MTKMLCAKEQRVLRSRKKQEYLDHCWGKVFCVPNLGECLCMRHYEQLRKSNTLTCCFPLKSVTDVCSGNLIKCPQRLISVFESLVENKENLSFDPHICKKHLAQADTEERIFNNEKCISPRKVRNNLYC